MVSIYELQDLVSNKKYNPYLDLNNQDKVLLHLIEELGELVQVYRKKGIYHEDFNKELGDVQILLLFFSSSTFTNLENVTLEKIKLNIKDGKFKPTKELIEKYGLE